MRAAVALAALVLLAACDPSISTAEEAVKRRLRDPDSAQFRSVEHCPRAGSTGVLGEVNAKNSVGGYAGFAHFIYIDGQLAILPAPGGESGGIETYPTRMEEWDTLFRRCNSDEINRAVDNAISGTAADPTAANASLDSAPNGQATPPPRPRRDPLPAGSLGEDEYGPAYENAIVTESSNRAGGIR